MNQAQLETTPNVVAWTQEQRKSFEALGRACRQPDTYRKIATLERRVIELEQELKMLWEKLA